MRLLKYLILLLLSLFTVSAEVALAQTGTTARPQSGPCNVPISGGILNEPNIFSEQQEEWLGEILAPQIEKLFKIVPDPEGYLQKLGDRLLAQLPKSNIRYRFTIIDLPENNSFGIPGGHIYVARRIIALARNEDELAGLLGHEIGHIITRQPAIDLTRELENILGVQQLGDRKDVLSKWNRLLDTWATKKEVAHNSKREDEEQLIADRIAIYAMVRSGYQPSRYVEFYDRLAQTKGNKGSFWTDLFGRTSHDAKRLRELLRASLPAMQACLVESADAGKGEQFFQWQKAVIAAGFAAGKETIPGLVAKQALNPPLRSDLRTLHFSPDGKYLLAQDETSVYVLSANPVTNLFRVDAPDTFAAQFTPDSRAIVFYDKELRVQKWDIEGKRAWVKELALAIHCLQTALSHSGEVLACLDEKLQPQLIDVGSSTILHKGSRLSEATSVEPLLSFLDGIGAGVSGELIAMRFSPDDHYFMTGRGKTVFAYNLKTNSVVALSKSIKELASYSFTFVSADEVAGCAFRAGTSAIVRARFPSGEIEDSFPWSFRGKLSAPDKGNYLLLLQGHEPAVTVLDWSTKKTGLMYKKAGFALYGDVFAGETAGGEIGLYSVSDKSYRAGADLPTGPLSFTTTSLFSPDGNWLAVSERTRGAVWNLVTGERVFLTRGFEGALFDEDQLLAKFPKQGKESAAVFKLDTKTKTMQNLYDLPSEASTPRSLPGSMNGALYWQQSNVLLKATQLTRQGKQQPYLIEVFDVRTNKKLWEHKTQNGLPYAFHSRTGHTVTVVIGDYEDMKAEAREDAALSAKLNTLVDEKRREASYILEVLDETTGKQMGKLLVDTGNLSFKIMSAVTIGDVVVVHDSEQRTLIYSLKTGEQKNTAFGHGLAVSKDGTKLLIENGNGKAALYDLLTLSPLMHYEFPHRVISAEFLGDESSLLVLTSDQTIYRLTMEVPAKSAAVDQP